MSGAWTNLVYWPNGLEFNLGFSTPLVLGNGRGDQPDPHTWGPRRCCRGEADSKQTSRGEIGSKLTQDTIYTCFFHVTLWIGMKGTIKNHVYIIYIYISLG